MTNTEDIFKTGIVLIIGTVLLSTASSLAITQDLLETFQKLGLSLVIFSVIVGILVRILDTINK